MKPPALAVVRAFALGIACGLSPDIAHRSSSHRFVALLLCGAATSLLIGIVFVCRSRVVVAGLASLLCWGMLGVAGVCIEEQPRRADYIVTDGERLEISCFVVCAELKTVSTSRRAEAPNQNQNNQ
jgi:hypothetical protein